MAFFSLAQAQSLLIKELNFGDKKVGIKDSLQLSLNLGKNKSLRLQIQIYGQAFSTKQQSYTLTRGADTSFWVYFQPEQNLAYLGAIFIGIEGNWWLKANLAGNGRLQNTYYASTFNLWDKELLTELKSITSKGQKSLGYNNARDEMYGDLDNYSGKVTCVYTGRTATFNTRSGANDNSINCEHTFPQSKFCSSESYMEADIHHLYPTDVSANSTRGNYPFGKVSGNPSWQQGGSKMGGGLFEPRDEQKGATARSMLYMVMRYGDCSGFLGSQENILRNWANNFAPTENEIARNTGIYKLQNNRNPFVDVPAFVDRIISIKGTTSRETKAEVVLIDTTLSAAEIADSAIYYAFISNIGNAALGIKEIVGDFDQYFVSNNTLEAGKALKIRFAFAGNVHEPKTAAIRFNESYLSEMEIKFDLASKSAEMPPLAPAFNIVNQTIYFSEIEKPFLMEVYSLNGALLKTATINGANQFSLPYLHGIYLLALKNDGFYTVSKIYLR